MWLCKLYYPLDDILKRILNIIIMKLLLTEDQERCECDRKPRSFACDRLNSFRNICKMVELQFIEAVSLCNLRINQLLCFGLRGT